MKLSKLIAFIIALLLALIIGLVIFVKEGGCDRDDGGGEEPEPAGCKAGDKTCKVDEPAPPPAPPPIGGAR